MDSGRSMVDRGVVEVAGAEARDLLQRLITNDVEGLTPGAARYAALLTPQGKILVDFLVISAPRPDMPERFLLDCPALAAPDLTRKLTLYKLRAKVTVKDLSAELAAGPIAERSASPDTGAVIYTDPRAEALGFRAIGPRDAVAGLSVSSEAYRARRVEAGVPEGGIDFTYGEAFPHEANFDRLHGVDFTKGCYVGQEVVSRMQHRGTARKRIATISFDGVAPHSGAEIRAGDLPVGTIGTVVERRGLATVRTDRVADAIAGNVALIADGQAITVGEAQPTLP